MILLDTNVVARISNSAHAHSALARRAVTVLRGRGEQLVIVPQTLYEFWAVATRKAGAAPAGQNGLGMSSGQASQWLRYFQRRLTLLPDREELLTRWHALVVALLLCWCSRGACSRGFVPLGRPRASSAATPGREASAYSRPQCNLSEAAAHAIALNHL